MKKNEVNIRPYTSQFYRGNWGYLALGLVQTLFLTAANLLISWLIQIIIDLISGEAVGLELVQVVGLFLLALVLIGVTAALAYFSRPRFAARALERYKNHVFEKLSKKGISAFSGENTSFYISALSNDVAAIEKGYIKGIFDILDQSALCIGALVMMFCYSPLLTLVSILLAALPLLASLLTGGWMAAAEKQVSDRNESYMASLRDSLVGFSVIKSFRAEKRMCRLFAQEVGLVARAQERRQRISVIVEFLSMTAGVTLQFGVFILGAWLVLSGGGLTAGSVMIFVQLLNYVIQPIMVVPRALAEIQGSKALITKLAQAVEANVRQEGTENKTELTDSIVLDDLSFAYEEGKPVLKNISFRFEKGKSYCLVGASGSGKSTLLNLLMAAHPDYRGGICYDAVPLQAIRSEALFEMVSVVQQNVFIFNASIRDNISMFSPFPKEEVDRAIELSGLARLVQERGEDYLCGENGSGLSGGEQQRISIARSLLKNAQVLLVDEATAALDTQTAAQVVNAILDLEGITSIVVTHALEESQLRRYDCILTLKNGHLTEFGSFDKLMEEKGYFYSLYTISQ